MSAQAQANPQTSEFIWKERGGGRLLVEPRLEAIVAPLAQPFDDFLFVEQ